MFSWHGKSLPLLIIIDKQLFREDNSVHSDPDLLLSIGEHSDDGGGVDEHEDEHEDDEHDTVTPDEDEDDDNDDGDNFNDDQSFDSNSDAEEPEHEHETPVGLTAVLPQMLFGSVSFVKVCRQ